MLPPLSISKLIKQIQGKPIAKIKKEFCGEMLGYGLHREVYALKQNPKYVLKIDRTTDATFPNVTEWRNYINNKEWHWFAEWLAPCHAIDSNGMILIQERITHGKRKDYPKYIPALFTDSKLANFGWIGDRFVCCDYSFLLQVVKSKTSRPMKYAKWWGSLKKEK